MHAHDEALPGGTIHDDTQIRVGEDWPAHVNSRNSGRCGRGGHRRRRRGWIAIIDQLGLCAVRSGGRSSSSATIESGGEDECHRDGRDFAHGKRPVWRPWTDRVPQRRWPWSCWQSHRCRRRRRHRCVCVNLNLAHVYYFVVLPAMTGSSLVIDDSSDERVLEHELAGYTLGCRPRWLTVFAWAQGCRESQSQSSNDELTCRLMHHVCQPAHATIQSQNSPPSTYHRASEALIIMPTEMGPCPRTTSYKVIQVTLVAAMFHGPDYLLRCSAA